MPTEMIELRNNGKSLVFEFSEWREYIYTICIVCVLCVSIGKSFEHGKLCKRNVNGNFSQHTAHCTSYINTLITRLSHYVFFQLNLLFAIPQTLVKLPVHTKDFVTYHNIHTHTSRCTVYTIFYFHHIRASVRCNSCLHFDLDLDLFLNNNTDV